MLEHEAYAVSEMAVGAYLQSLAAGQPARLLPVTMLGRFHHSSISVRIAAGIASPRELEGRRVGVRAYSQTTGLWARGILHSEFGVDLADVHWITAEASHVPGYEDPPNVTRDPRAVDLRAILRDGVVDAALMASTPGATDGIEPLFADARELELAWFERTHVVPINHVLMVSQSVLDAHIELISALWSALRDGKERYLTALRASGGQTPDERMQVEVLLRGGDPLPFGVETMLPALEMAIDFAHTQRLIPRRFAVDDLFDTRVLAICQ
jgi:4,5-dihydroxyphthalate decarboxylase